MPLLYNFIFFIYGVVYLPYLLVTGRWHKDFCQRFGIFPDALKQVLAQRSNIWIHAVSVGEVMAVEGLIRQIKERWPQHQLVLSVTTKTGYELAQQRLSTQVIVIAAPLDFSWVAQSFVRLIKPQLYIAAETEIWPNLFAYLDHQKIPLMIINGRLSDKSFPRYQKIKGLLKGVLAHVNVFCMQSQMDAGRIIDLGANRVRVIVTGNIKFDDVPKLSDMKAGQLGLKEDQLLLIGGSTHPGEEKILLDVFKKISIDQPAWRLVLAPRHIERTTEVVQLVEQAGFKAVKFSSLSPSQALGEGVIIVDTIGHLRSLYALASLVFVGKSLCVGGGHNIIEPAFFAKPIIIGPKMENFRDIVAAFKQNEAICQVSDEAGFEAAVRDLMTHPQKRADLGQKARAVINQNQGATHRTVEQIALLLKGAH